MIRFEPISPCSWIKLALFCLALLGSYNHTVYGEEASFRFESFSGNTVSIDRQPVFIITTHSEKDLKEALRCATLASSQQGAFWVINFAWEQSSEIKRRAASKLLKEDFMKSRSTVLGPEYRLAARMILIEPNGAVSWSCKSFPSDEEWTQALSIWASLEHSS